MKYNYFKSCLVLGLLSFLIGCSVNESNLELNSDTSALSPKEHKEVLKELHGKQMETIGSSSNSSGGSSVNSGSGLLMPDSQILLLASSNSSCEEKDTVDVFSEAIAISHVNKYQQTLHIDNEKYTICYYWQENRDLSKGYSEKYYYYDDQFQLSYIEEYKKINVTDSRYRNHEITYSRIKNNDGVIKFNQTWENYNDADVVYYKGSSNNNTYSFEQFYSKPSDSIIEIEYANLYYPEKSSWNSKVSFNTQTFKFENKTINLDISLIVNKDDNEYIYYTYFSIPDPSDIVQYIYSSPEDRIAQVNPVGKVIINEDISMDIYYLDETGSYTSVSQ